MALELDKHHQETWAQLGICYFLRNDLGSALEALETALALNPDDVNALRHLALVNLSLGHNDVAISQFKQVLRLKPDDDESRLDLAVIFLSAHRTSSALEQLEGISGGVRESHKYRFYLGLALQQDGQEEMAQDMLHQLAELPNDTYGAKARKMLLVS